MSLDRKNKELLNQLYLNSRQSFVQLGKKLRLSSSAVQRRLQQLQHEGIIFFPLANVNFANMGLRSYRLYFKFDALDKKTESEVLQVFENHPRTLWGVVCEGEFDALCRILAKDEFEVERFAALMVEKFGPKIVEKTVVTTTYQLYFPWDKAFGTERSKSMPPEVLSKTQELDAADTTLLRELYGNSRASSVELAGKAGLTPDAINYRIKRLQKNGLILGWSAWFDAKKLGFNYYKFLVSFRSITPQKERQLLSFCAQNYSVVFINKAIGGWDIEIDVIVRNNSDLHEFTRELKTKFGHIIGRHSFISIVEERMLNPLRGEK